MYDIFTYITIKINQMQVLNTPNMDGMGFPS